MVFRKRGGANKYCELKQKEGDTKRVYKEQTWDVDDDIPF